MRRLVVVVVAALLFLGCCPAGARGEAGALHDGPMMTIAHLTDLEALSSRAPELLNQTFRWLEEHREEYNISLVVITGDLVEQWDNETQWGAFLNATEGISIPIATLAGDDDCANGQNYTYYEKYVGPDRLFYHLLVGPFVILMVSWPNPSNALNETLIEWAQGVLSEHEDKWPIICTHAYCEKVGYPEALSPVGQQIYDYLVGEKTTVILQGHVHDSWYYKRHKGPTVIHEFCTNYQEELVGVVRLITYQGPKDVVVREIKVAPGPDELLSEVGIKLTYEISIDVVCRAQSIEEVGLTVDVKDDEGIDILERVVLSVAKDGVNVTLFWNGSWWHGDVLVDVSREEKSPTEVIWGLVLNFSGMDVGSWRVDARAEDVYGRVATSSTEFTWLAFWSSMDVYEANEWLREQGLPHVVEATTAVEYVNITGTIMTLYVAEGGQVVINCSSWGKPSWVSLDGRFITRLEGREGASYDRGLLLLMVESEAMIGWAMTGAGGPVPPPPPPPEEK